jgi:DNA-binding MarR family transcriptional regulator
VLEAYDRFHQRIASLHAPEVADLNLTLAQLKAIYLVAAAGSIRMGALAVQLGTALSTTSGVVDRLVQTGQLERLEDPSDRRQVLVRATPAAMAQLESMSELGRGRIRELVLRLSNPADIDTVKHALNLLADAAAALNEDSPS